MKTITERLSQYNFLTNLLPGTILCTMLRYLVGFDVGFSTEWYRLIVIFYFVGMVNNRVGSLLVEPILRRFGIIKPMPYETYVLAEQHDEKIRTLMTENNVYRSCLSVCLIVLISFGYKWLMDRFCFLEENTSLILLVFMIVLFVFSFRKQTRYISNRVKQADKKTSVLIKCD